MFVLISIVFYLNETNTEFKNVDNCPENANATELPVRHKSFALPVVFISLSCSNRQTKTSLHAFVTPIIMHLLIENLVVGSMTTTD